MPESSDEPIRRENFRKPGRQECADWEAQLNQAILATDIREGWEGFVELFDRFYDEEVMVVTGYDGAGVSGQGANRERLLQVLVPLHVVTELDVVQIERFELKESVVAESERLDLRGSLRQQVQRRVPEACVELPDASGGKDE